MNNISETHKQKRKMSIFIQWKRKIFIGRLIVIVVYHWGLAGQLFLVYGANIPRPSCRHAHPCTYTPTQEVPRHS